MSFDPVDIFQGMKKYIPDFKIDFNVDSLREEIVNSWPNSLDDSAVR
jgi:hypothetical protein